MKHSICKLKGDFYNNNNIIIAMVEVCEIFELNVVGSEKYSFSPIGLTAIFLLAESHFSVHTFPEKDSLYADIFCCNENVDTEECLKYLSAKLNSEIVSIKTLER